MNVGDPARWNVKLVYVAYSPLDLQAANSIQTYHTCRELAAQLGGDLRVVVPRFGMREAPPPFPVVKIPRVPLNKLTRFWRSGWWSIFERTLYAWLVALYLKTRGVKPDAVYCRDIICAYWLLRLGAPLIYEVHDLEARHPSKMKSAHLTRWLERVDEQTLRGARAVVSLTETFRRELLARGWQSSTRVFVIPDAYDAAVYYPRARAAMRAALAIPRAALVLAYAGLTFAYRGLEVLLDAFRAWGEPSARLYLIGGRAGEIKELKELARALGIGDAVVFTGRLAQKETARYLSAADILVIPGTVTDATASPLKMFEYLALGAAIVAVDRPALREVLIDGTAEFFRAGDRADLARALRAVAETAARREALGTRALARAAEFSYTRRAEKIIAACQAIVGR